MSLPVDIDNTFFPLCHCLDLLFVGQMAVSSFWAAIVLFSSIVHGISVEQSICSSLNLLPKGSSSSNVMWGLHSL